jgi:hypothetical protein
MIDCHACTCHDSRHPHLAPMHALGYYNGAWHCVLYAARLYFVFILLLLHGAMAVGCRTCCVVCKSNDATCIRAFATHTVLDCCRRTPRLVCRTAHGSFDCLHGEHCCGEVHGSRARQRCKLLPCGRRRGGGGESLADAHGQAR